jgi:hypothetical protein
MKVVNTKRFRGEEAYRHKVRKQTYSMLGGHRATKFVLVYLRSYFFRLLTNGLHSTGTDLLILCLRLRVQCVVGDQSSANDTILFEIGSI